ncbi:cytidine deaminase [Parerythrobacter lacustris]|uniref:Cytidine deaminase n=1 Tax=Parerythrobacter lacustris TaxID=2969984 RepID=A0ABT1XLU1_9SPHN|nr:cytidine deaminase [Parerythrobacter lacustris]MCR2832626.1 cytidine deaminase [Parerythrobacter lacustris]
MTDDELIAAARAAAGHSYSPYSGFAVGAALRFTDGRVFTGTNIENAAYGPTVCAERVAVFKAMSEGVRGGLETVAVTGPPGKGGGSPITPCGVCRQVLTELAQLGGTDPDILCVGDHEVRKVKLTELLPHAFGPASLK